MTSQRPDPDDELDVEFDQLATEPLRVGTIDAQTGERRVDGVVSRMHLATAMIERDEQP